MSERVVERMEPLQKGRGYREIWLAGGCFWGAEKYLKGIRGVVATSVGYANGHTQIPTYEAVCTQTTGYAETVHVTYDPAALPLPFLLRLFFRAIDPTSVNRQGGDVGDQYRTGVYYTDDRDGPVVEAALGALAATLKKPVAVEARPLKNYYLAEPYHQAYLDKNPGGYCHVSDAACRAAAQANPYAKSDDATLRAALTDMQYRVTQQAATEPPFDNAFNDHFAPGIYVDVTTGEPLFLSKDKFASACGWPAFAKPVCAGAVVETPDFSHGMARTEVRSGGGDAHLGHLFADGPSERGGLRYCVNSAALRFIPKADMAREGYGGLVERLGDREGDD